jgi:hypothetical protein
LSYDISEIHAASTLISKSHVNCKDGSSHFPPLKPYDASTHKTIIKIYTTSNFDVFLTVHHSIVILFTNFNSQFLYSLTICMLHYKPRHVSSINMPIFRKTNCIITASGIVTLCKRLYSMPDESSHPAYLISKHLLYIHFDRKS